MTATDTTSTAEKVATYESMVVAYCAEQTPELLAHVQRAYQSLPSATRGGAYAATLAAVATGDYADALPSLIAAHADLPTTTASRTERRTVTDAESDAIRRCIVDVLDAMLHDIASGAFDGEDGPDEFLRTVHSDAVDTVRRYVEKLTIGAGKRTSHDVDPTDVVPAGSDIVCQYKGTNTVGTLNADGSVTVGDDTYPSLSKAAIAVTGQPTANGWVHWRYDGEKLAVLRDRA